MGRIPHFALIITSYTKIIIKIKKKKIVIIHVFVFVFVFVHGLEVCML